MPPRQRSAVTISMVFRCLILTASSPALFQQACAGCADAITTATDSTASLKIPLILCPLFPFNRAKIDEPIYRTLKM